MSITSNRKFDVIVYGASFAGVLVSKFFKSIGKEVLLLNRYGFLGGSITESLSLYQRKITSNESGLIADIFNKIKSENDGILFEDNTHVVLNAEVVKFVLQKVVEENHIDSLFHIHPYEIDFRTREVQLSVFGKEGKIVLRSNQVYDCTTEYSLAPLVKKSTRKLIGSRINIISLPVKDEKIFNHAYRKLKLNNNRWWISIENKTLNLMEVEIVAHAIIARLDEDLRKQKSRILIVPAQSNMIFAFHRTKDFDRRIKFITDFISEFNEEDELFVASKMEENLKNASSI